MKSIQEMFPNASKDTVAANPHLLSPNGGSGNKNTVQSIVATRRGVMNKPEQSYADILEVMKRKGEILRYEFEGITLRFAGVKYTPDFVVFTLQSYVSTEEGIIEEPFVKFIEVKGPFIKGNRERAVERFRHAKTYWKEFTFEMHQKTHNGWKQIL